jgi:hypothetical protein
MTIWGYRIQWFDVFTVICGIICSAMYSWYIGNWLKGMSIGPLMFILGWMTMEWFILGDDDYSRAQPIKDQVSIGPPRPTTPGDRTGKNIEHCAQ